MKFFMISFFIFLLYALVGCTVSNKIYKENERVVTGKFSEAQAMAIRTFLINDTKVDLTDTIIIKYDYNNDQCWTMLDNNDDAYITKVLTSHQSRMEKRKTQRNNISIFEYREQGNDFSKYKYRDTNIRIDSTGKLSTYIFNDRAICGTSILILPSNEYIIIRSDSHFEILDFSPKKINELLQQKINYYKL